jgi:HIRAN domain
MVTIDVKREERYWYPDDGGIVWLAGYMPIDRATRSFLGRDALRERGLIVSGVAGAAAHHDGVLQSDAAEPGAALVLRRDPGNEHDPNAVKVCLGGEQLGWVPRDLAAELAPRLDAGEEWSAVILREQRPSPRDSRTGVTMLLAAAVGIELVEAVA